ncbi:MAG: acetylxylan esterase [Lentisphaeria bacterium]|nr:acetylxylan esterase [Lentisphaeria bacterium]
MEEKKLPLITIRCDRPSHVYRMGEYAVFEITSEIPGVEVEATFTADGEAELERFKITTPCSLKYTLPFPGFLRCTAEADGMTKGLAGAAFDPGAIRPVLPAPEDFQKFWQNALAKQEMFPANFHSEELTSFSDEKFQVFLLECDTVNNQKCYAHLRMPRNKSNIPMLVYYDGAGPSLCNEYFMLHCKTAYRYLSDEVAHLAIFTHPYRPPMTRKEHENIHKEYVDSLGSGSSYWNSGLEKGVEHTFFYRAILGAVRMCNIVSEMPEIDKTHITCLGGSQGGGFGIFITALCPHINAVCSGVPAFCDCGGFLAGHHSTTSENPVLRKYYKHMRYFDPANFAPMIKVPVYMSCGFIDTTCQPSGIYAVYNELHGNKIMFHKTLHGHADGPAEYAPLLWFWVGCHLGLHK